MRTKHNNKLNHTGRSLRGPGRDDFSDAVLALLDGEQVDWSRLDESGKSEPGALEALRLLESIKNIYDSAPVLAPAMTPHAPAATRLQIHEEIGRGAFGRVCRARDLELQREVAVKIVPALHESSFAILQEARALARVEHPHVVRIYHVSQDISNIYIEMELVDGERLDHWLARNGPPAPAEAARMAVQVADALAAIHREGLIHGDVKPANLMRRHDGRIVLLDFGLARFTSLQKNPEGALPRGTPAVMAPEQLIPGEVPGPRADLYSLAVVLYWLASGKYPFVAATFAELRERVSAGAHIPLASICKNVDSALIQIVERGMAPQARQRFATAEEFASALRNYLSKCDLDSRPFLCEANVFVKRNGGDLRVRSGGNVRIGDRLSLEVTLDREASVYVFNESDAGEFYLLFPLPGMNITNPLPAGSHRLPGRRGRSPMYWTVNSDGGGGEKILILATCDGILQIDEIVKNAPRASETEAIVYPRIPAHVRNAVMRGIGGLATGDAESGGAARRGGRLDSLVREIEDSRGATREPWCRLIELKNVSL